MSSAFLDLWYAALAAELGICVATTNRDILRQKLYAARKAANDPDLDSLSLILSPTDDSQIWIIRNAKSL